MTQDLTLLDAAIKKMHWHEKRQQVLGQNIANADTPGYKPYDVDPIDFKELLGTTSSTTSVSAAVTSPRHLSLHHTLLSSDTLEAKPQRKTSEVSPSGNSVVMEEQLLKLNQNFVDHQLTTTIFQKYADMVKRSERAQ